MAEPSSGSTVTVSNIGHDIGEKKIREFFSFCGKITGLSVTPTSSAPDSSQSATITFENPTAATTALLLNETHLEGSNITVERTHSLDQLADDAETKAHHDDEIRQEDKPRSTVFAEYLAHGYVLRDQALEQAIALDKKHGISDRFKLGLGKLIETHQQVEQKYHPTDRALAVDKTYGVSNKATQIFNTVQRYYEKAAGTPTGQQLLAFYSKSVDQVADIHKEAERLKGLKQDAAREEAIKRGDVQKPVDVAGTEGKKSYCTCGGSEGVCGCEAGKCSCDGCTKANVSGGASGSAATTNPYAPPPTEKYA